MPIPRLRRNPVSFTLVELMIVVVIVAILATLAVTMYRENVVGAKMSEAITGVGLIHRAARVRIANGGLPDPCDFATLRITEADMNGKYFTLDDYSFQRLGDTEYTVRATLPSDPSVYFEINQDGVQSGTYRTDNPL